MFIFSFLFGEDEPNLTSTNSMTFVFSSGSPWKHQKTLSMALQLWRKKSERPSTTRRMGGVPEKLSNPLPGGNFLVQFTGSWGPMMDSPSIDGICSVFWEGDDQDMNYLSPIGQKSTYPTWTFLDGFLGVSVIEGWKNILANLVGTIKMEGTLN